MGYAYNPDGQWTSAHQMSINGKFSDITKDDLLECGAKNNVKNAARIIDEVCQAVSMWPKIARECEVPQNMIEEILPKHYRRITIEKDLEKGFDYRKITIQEV